MTRNNGMAVRCVPRVFGGVVLSMLGLLGSGTTLAAGAGYPLEMPRIDTGNEQSLQRGAQVFMNNCMGCHSLGYHRYSHLADDLGLSEDQVAENLIFTTDEEGEDTKIGSLMFNNMSEEYGEAAFGVMPPNLSLTARSRGVDWIYTYLKTFYIDPDRGGVGVNNLVYPGASMPHVLADYQGWQTAVYEERNGEQVAVGVELSTEGSMSPEEYDNMITDLTAFLAYVSDPTAQDRYRIGIFVMLFLAALFVIAYMLKREYWKDVVKNDGDESASPS